MIQAEAHSDDHVLSVQFDAEPWFAQASNTEIEALAKCDWGGDYPADAVAIYIAEEYEPKLAMLFQYLEAIADVPSKKDCKGFECHVDERDALKWLEANRGDLYQQWCATKE